MYDTRRGERPAAIDVRSDTVTNPTGALRQAMADAEVGDDVYGEDPTVNRLEAAVADLLGKEAALFVTSGTQSNLCGVLSHCGRGEEYLIGAGYHVYAHEAMGTSVLGSVVGFPLKTDPDGGLSAGAVEAAVKPDDSHKPVTRLLCVENTTNGSALSLTRMAEPIEAARQRGLSVHLDGARLFNAAVSLGIEPHALVAPVDTVSVCLSKGLGAPAGSVLVGPSEHITRARRMRKMLGGGMRQAGVLAAAGLYALDHHIDRLADDHRRATELAATIDRHPMLELLGGEARTNMVWLRPLDDCAARFVDHLAARGINAGAPGQVMRVVMHLDIGDDELAALVDAVAAFD